MRELSHSRVRKIYSTARHLHPCRALKRFPVAIPASQHADLLPRRAIVNRAGFTSRRHMNEKQIAASRRIHEMMRNIEPDTVGRCRAWKAGSACDQSTGNETPRHYHPKVHGFSAANTVKVNLLPGRIRQNEKSEKAERSEPNPGKVPGRAHPGFSAIPKIPPTPENRFFCQLSCPAILLSATAPGGCRVFPR